MGKQRGRPPGKKDVTQRKEGRWSEQTRAKLGVPAKSASRNPSVARAGASTNSQDIRQCGQAAASSSSGGNSSAGHARMADSAAGEAEAAAAAADEADEAEAVDETEAGADDDEVEAADEAAEHGARDGVETTEIDNDEGLRAADSRDSITMQYFRLIRARLQLELSNRKGHGLTDRWLLAMLKADDYWLRARNSRSILKRLGSDIAGFASEYVRDLRVWLPHVEFGIMPVHHVCGSAVILWISLLFFVLLCFALSNLFVLVSPNFLNCSISFISFM